LPGHFRHAVFFSDCTVTLQQLKFGTAEIARAQVNFDLRSIRNWQAVTVVTKETLRGRTTRRFTKIIHW